MWLHTRSTRPGVAHRWLARCGGLLVLIVAAAAISLPALLPPLPEPAELPPPPQLYLDRPAVGLSDQASPGAAQPSAEKRAATPEQRAPSAPPTSGKAAPVEIPRRARGGALTVDDLLPRGHEPPPPTEALDRSPTARELGLRQFGGTPRTESAVEAGLAWLAAHQSPDGTWDRFHFAELDPPDDRCTGEAILRTDGSLRAGLTGLCLLAFLGAGYTGTEGPYPQVVRNGVDALLAMQERDGGFLYEDYFAGYNDSLATFALAEYYALTRSPRIAEPLNRAVSRLVRSQQARGGWDYERRNASGRNDTSITAWVVQALHACAAAGIDVPPETLIRATLHFARATEPDGRVRYADAGTGFELDDSMQPKYRYGPAMAAAGLTCQQLLGCRINGPVTSRQAAILLAEPPAAARFHGRDRTQLHSEYYWYYGTVAMFQRGGTDWQRWNAHLRDAILPLQSREKTKSGQKRSAYGSWDPYAEHWGQWGMMGSRVYTTAICVLTLEIYYRHTPAYLTEDPLLTADHWRAHLRATNPGERREAVGCLEHLRVEIGEPVLADLLDNGDHAVALAAAEALARTDSPLGLPLLEEAVATLPPWRRRSIEPALRRARELAALPPVEGQVRVFDPERKLATLDLPRAYVGMPISVQRDGREVAQMRVIRRFTGRTVVVAELIGKPGHSQPRSGDIGISQ